MTDTPPLSAKDQVLAWVISKAGKAETLQELLIAYEVTVKENSPLYPVCVWDLTTAQRRIANLLKKYDLTKNLHNQEDPFYEAILPLIV